MTHFQSMFDDIDARRPWWCLLMMLEAWLLCQLCPSNSSYCMWKCSMANVWHALSVKYLVTRLYTPNLITIHKCKATMTPKPSTLPESNIAKGNLSFINFQVRAVSFKKGIHFKYINLCQLLEPSVTFWSLKNPQVRVTRNNLVYIGYGQKPNNSDHQDHCIS